MATSVFDAPFPFSDPLAQQLHRSLYELHREPRRAISLAEEVGVPVEKINTQQAIDLLWADILRETATAGLTRKLVERSLGGLHTESPYRALLEKVLQSGNCTNGTIRAIVRRARQRNGCSVTLFVAVTTAVIVAPLLLITQYTIPQVGHDFAAVEERENDSQVSLYADYAEARQDTSKAAQHLLNAKQVANRLQAYGPCKQDQEVYELRRRAYLVFSRHIQLPLFLFTVLNRLNETEPGIADVASTESITTRMLPTEKVELERLAKDCILSADEFNLFVIELRARSDGKAKEIVAWLDSNDSGELEGQVAYNRTSSRAALVLVGKVGREEVKSEFEAFQTKFRFTVQQNNPRYDEFLKTLESR